MDFGCGTGMLAELVSSDRYLGFDTDQTSLQQAQLRFPEHRFLSNVSLTNDKFDTVVSCAVIEHVGDRAGFLRTLAGFLKNSPDSRLILTTPHPSVEWIYELGANIGLFSKHASDDHEDLLDGAELEELGGAAGLVLVAYWRFLVGANQVAVFKQCD